MPENFAGLADLLASFDTAEVENETQGKINATRWVRTRLNQGNWNAYDVFSEALTAPGCREFLYANQGWRFVSPGGAFTLDALRDETRNGIAKAIGALYRHVRNQHPRPADALFKTLFNNLLTRLEEANPALRSISVPSFVVASAADHLPPIGAPSVFTNVLQRYEISCPLQSAEDYQAFMAKFQRLRRILASRGFEDDEFAVHSRLWLAARAPVTEPAEARRDASDEAEENERVGRKGEEWVYNQIKERAAWVQAYFATNFGQILEVEWVSRTNRYASHDIKIHFIRSRECLVEVKTTKSNKFERFFLSESERLTGSANESWRMVLVQDIDGVPSALPIGNPTRQRDTGWKLFHDGWVGWPTDTANPGTTCQP